MMITAVVSKKGGVGKTTTAVSLAAALAGAGYRVLLVDLDGQASASLSLGVPRSALAPSVADVLLWGTPLREAIRGTGVPHLDLVTASVDLVSADLELGVYRERETRLARVLDRVRSDYDFLFLDCPPGMGLLAVNALAAADAFLVPVSPQYLAIAGVDSLLAAAERLRMRHNRRLALAGILLTLVDYRSNETRRNVDLLRGSYGDRVFAVEVRVNVRLAEAPAAARTIFQYDPEATGARAYRLAAREFLLRTGELRRAPAAPIQVGA
jgi:chromosome partitioning protein